MSEERDAPDQGGAASAAFLEKIAHDVRGPTGVMLGALDELELALGPELVAAHTMLLSMARRGAQKVLKVADALEKTAEDSRREDGQSASQQAAPQKVAASPRSANGSGNKSNGAKQAVGERLRVLVVEDDDDAVELMAMTLEQAGFQPIIARSLLEAKERLSNDAPCAVVTDLQLPDGPGLDVLGLTGADKLRARFVLSGHDDPEKRRTSIARGFQEHLVKPVDSALLLSLLDRYLGRSG